MRYTGICENVIRRNSSQEATDNTAWASTLMQMISFAHYSQNGCDCDFAIENEGHYIVLHWCNSFHASDENRADNVKYGGG